MAQLRFVRNPNKRAQSNAGLDCTVTSLRSVYVTDPAIHAALLPAPLEAGDEPHIFIQHANVTMHVSPTEDVSVGAATVGVKCRYKDTVGHYVLAMPMQGEFVVIGGRERFGEPKKLAEVAAMERDGDAIRTCIGRHGINFLEMRGKVGGELPRPEPFTEYFFCHKALPSIDRADAFDGPVYLTRLNWERNYSRVFQVEQPEIILRESAYDPLVDVPVLDILSMQLAEGNTRTSGQILEEIPGENLLDFIDQRYDTPGLVGIEVAAAGEGVRAHG